MLLLLLLLLGIGRASSSRRPRRHAQARPQGHHRAAVVLRRRCCASAGFFEVYIRFPPRNIFRLHTRSSARGTVSRSSGGRPSRTANTMLPSTPALAESRRTASGYGPGSMFGSIFTLAQPHPQHGASSTTAAAACGYEYELKELQQYNGYAYDTGVVDARTRREVHEAFSADFERTYPSELTAKRLCRPPTLWQCLKNAFEMPRA